jgi:hypothetical protein
VLALLGFLAPHVTAVVLAGCTCVVAIALAGSDRWFGEPAAPE